MNIPDNQRERNVGRPWQILTNCVLTILFIGSGAAALAMAGLLFVGFTEIYAGSMEGVHAGLHGWQLANGPTSERAAHQVIRGVEMLLLAPLAYFVVVNLARYVNTWMLRGDDEAGKASLLGVKALVVGLLIAMIATDLVGKILSEEGLDRQSAIFESLIILVLTAYCFGLEWIASTVLKRHSTKPDSQEEAVKERAAQAGK